MALFASRSATAAAAWVRRLASQAPSRPANPCGGPEPCKTHKPPCRGDEKPPAIARVRVCCPPAVGNRPPCPVKNLEKTWTCEQPLRREIKKPCVDVPPAQDCECDEFYVMRRIAAAKEKHRALYKEEVCAGEPPAPPPTAPYCMPLKRDTLYGVDGRRYELLEPLPPARCTEPGCPPPARHVSIASDTCPKAAVRPCDHVPRDVVQMDRCSHRPVARCAGASLPCDPPKPDNPCKQSMNQQKQIKCQSGTSGNKNDQGLASRLMKTLNINQKGDEPKKN